MQILLITYGDSECSKWFEISVENKRRYCEKWGYSIIAEQSCEESYLPASWNKIKLARRYLAGYDWVFWTDIDSLVMNMAIGVESIIPETGSFIVGSDGNGPNLGQFLIRNCSWSEELLRKIWYHPYNCDQAHSLWWEQSALHHLMEEDYADDPEIYVSEQRVMNSYPDLPCYQVGGNAHHYYRPGEFIVHFAGKEAKQEFELFERMSSQVVGHIGDDLTLTGNGIACPSLGVTEEQESLQLSPACQLKRNVSKTNWIYHRIGFDQRRMTFLADGRIGAGRAECETHWQIVSDQKGRSVLEILGQEGTTCKLRETIDGSWEGNWRIHERMPILLSPEGFPESAERSAVDSVPRSDFRASADIAEWRIAVEAMGRIERGIVSMDLSHAALIYGLAVALKPKSILELGVGSGLSSIALYHATVFNRMGNLRIVDNFADWCGRRPEIVDVLTRYHNVDLVCSSESAFVHGAPTNEYDMLVSDADHAGDWQSEFIRIVRTGGIIAFHDTNNPEFPNLLEVEGILEGNDIAYKHFKTSSRSDERCERGLLIAFL